MSTTKDSVTAQPSLDLEDEVLCRSLLFRMYECVDSGKAEEALPLFSSDAVFQTPTTVNRGIAEIHTALAARQAKKDRRTRHVVTNLRIWLAADGIAHATGTLLLFVLNESNPMTPNRIAEIRDEFVPEGKEWKIKSHGSQLIANRG